MLDLLVILGILALLISLIMRNRAMQLVSAGLFCLSGLLRIFVGLLDPDQSGEAAMGFLMLLGVTIMFGARWKSVKTLLKDSRKRHP